MAYILSHDHLSIDASELVSNIVELLAAHVVNVDQNGLLVLFGEIPEFLPVLFLSDSLFRLLLLSSH